MQYTTPIISFWLPRRVKDTKGSRTLGLKIGVEIFCLVSAQALSLYSLFMECNILYRIRHTHIAYVIMVREVDCLITLLNVQLELPVDKYQVERQLEGNTSLRAVLIDSIDEVYLQFRLIAETFQMAVVYNDM
ncbi:hypothetical protein GQX74_010075 [Glossina fuscipes]|nr:hypothetical protein GQX74_010075 [Glossina fuscipes]